MPNFDAESLLHWFHFISLVIAGGAMPVCLMLSGFEDANEDVRGLSALVWKKMAVWGLRFAVFFGVALFILYLFKGCKPFTQPHLMFLLPMGAILVFLCETAPKSLGVGKRGLAMLTLVLFLVTSFIASIGSHGKAFLPSTADAAPQTELDTDTSEPSNPPDHSEKPQE